MRNSKTVGLGSAALMLAILALSASPARAHIGLSVSPDTITTGGTVTLTMVIHSGGTVTIFTVVDPTGTATAALNPANGLPISPANPVVLAPDVDFSRVYPTDFTAGASTSEVGTYTAGVLSSVGPFTGIFLVSFFVIPEFQLGVIGLIGASFAALVGLRRFTRL